MENEIINTGAVPETVEKTQETPAAPGAGAERTYTQAELDSLVESRLARERKKYPAEAELNDYRKWKKEHETDAEKLTAITRERDEALSQLEEARQERYVIGKGADPDEVEFIVYKARKSVDDNTTFEQAADSILKTRKKRPSGPYVDWGAPLSGGGGSKNTNDTMNALIRGARS